MTKERVADRQRHLTFWRHARNGEFWVPRCTTCEAYVFYPRAVCPQCTGTQFRWIQVDSDGAVVFSHTTVHVASAPRFTADLPYLVGLVDFPCGVRVLARLCAVRPEQDLCGLPVRFMPSRPRDGLYFDVLDQPGTTGSQEGAP